MVLGRNLIQGLKFNIRTKGYIRAAAEMWLFFIVKTPFLGHVSFWNVPFKIMRRDWGEEEWL